jgi:hypothetical protein
MVLETTAENKANLENYEHAQRSIDTVLENIKRLKGEGANSELLSQIERLDEAYENAIRIRAMRIQTLESHCGDRDSELVELRKAIVARDRSVFLSKLGHVAWILVTLFLGILFILPWLPPAVIKYLSVGVGIVLDNIPQTPLFVSVISSIATLACVKSCL